MPRITFLLSVTLYGMGKITRNALVLTVPTSSDKNVVFDLKWNEGLPVEFLDLLVFQRASLQFFLYRIPFSKWKLRKKVLKPLFY